jgi:hypothetical protein
MFEVWVELVCVVCSATIGGQFATGSSLPRRTMKSEAVEHGWSLSDEGEWRCRKCTGKPVSGREHA